MDGIEFPFENVLNYAAFAVRVAEADLPRLPAILRAIPPERVAALQRGVKAVRQRFTYGSLAPNELRISPSRSSLSPVLAPVVEAAARSEDALDTVMRILLLRAARRKAAGGAV